MVYPLTGAAEPFLNGPWRTPRNRTNRHFQPLMKHWRQMLVHHRSRQIDIVSLDERHRRLTKREFSRPFASSTFDERYRDNRDFALPLMREFDAPFAVWS